MVIRVMERIAELWAGIADWLQINAPKTFATLQPGADSAMLDRLAEDLRLELPDELVASLRCHNGADNSHVGPGFSFPGMFHVLDAAGIAAEAEVGATLLRSDPKLHGWYWHEAWIPIAADFAGDALVYDTRPERPFGAVFYHHLMEGPFGGSWATLEDLLQDTLHKLVGLEGVLARPLPADYPLRGGWARTRPAAHNGELRWEDHWG